MIFDERGVATNLIEKVGRPILRLARWRLDLPAIVLGMLPFVNAANVAAEIYDRVLFRRATLQELSERPRFVFNATSLQTGSLWRFSRDYAAEYRVGHWPAPDLRLAVAVGASAAFPPFLSPVSIRLGHEVVKPFRGRRPFTRAVHAEAPPYRRRRLRQPRIGADLETLPHAPGERRRVGDAGEGSSSDGLAAARRCDPLTSRSSKVSTCAPGFSAA